MSFQRRRLDSRSRSPGSGNGVPTRQRRRSRIRRRAPTACKTCRQRKTRCDNARPSCGYCSLHCLECIYSGDSPEPLSVPEPSNSVLLEKLEHVVALLQRDTHTSILSLHDATDTAIDDVPQTSQHDYIDSEPNVSGRSATGRSDFTDAGFGQLEISEKAARTVACETILCWPIFSGLVPHQEIKSLLLICDDGTDISSPEWPHQGKPMRPALATEDIMPLCNKFRALILVKNPFMTARDFSRYAREVAENGPGWDGPSCLVLLACAIACLATHFIPINNLGDAPGEETLTTTGHVDKEAAEAYYTAAQKRLGLTHSSLIAVQCYYFAGLFEKFSLRPLKAWSLFQQACIHFQAGIWKRANAISSNGSTASANTRHFEQRLYWSCVKAECELRAEIQFPSSGLLKFKYPENFPALSMPAPHQQSTDADLIGQTEDASLQLDFEEENSWLYYLAEISLRGITNRILEHIYSEGEHSWTRHESTLLNRFDASHEELLLWRSHLPEQLRFDENLPILHELTSQLQSRYYVCQEWIHRPFLYRILFEIPSGTKSDRVAALAHQCLDYASIIIKAVAHPHRFGGIWFNMRRTFSNAMLILAAARSGKLTLPNDWHSYIILAMQTLAMWESEAPDLRYCRQILESVFNGIGSTPELPSPTLNSI